MAAFGNWCEGLETFMPHRSGTFRQAAADWKTGRESRAAGDVAAALRKELERIRRYEATGTVAADLTLAEHVKQVRDRMSAAGRAARNLATTLGQQFKPMGMPELMVKIAMMFRPVRNAVEEGTETVVSFLLGNTAGSVMKKLVHEFPGVVVSAVGWVRNAILNRREIAAKAREFGRATREAAKAVAGATVAGFRRAAERVRTGAAKAGDFMRRGAQLARSAAGHVVSGLKKASSAVAEGLKKAGKALMSLFGF